MRSETEKSKRTQNTPILKAPMKAKHTYIPWILALPLSDARCDICRHGLLSTSVTSTNNGKIHNIKQPVTCKTKNVCYLINCKKCSQQYTGKTKLEFHLRMSNRKSDIRTNKKSTGMIRHFNNCGVTNTQPSI